jgi:hypothetical protein
MKETIRSLIVEDDASAGKMTVETAGKLAGACHEHGRRCDPGISYS